MVKPGEPVYASGFFSQGHPMIRTALLFSLALLSAPAFAQAAGPNIDIPPAPGLEKAFGGCSSLPGQDPCAYALTGWKDPKTDQVVSLLAGKSQNNGNPPDFLETDRIAVPKLAPGYFISTVCRAPGDHFNNTTVVAAVRFKGDEDVSKDVSHAWRLDTRTGKFAVINPKTIGCDYEGP
jgi:hypothetical protein